MMRSVRIQTGKQLFVVGTIAALGLTPGRCATAAAVEPAPPVTATGESAPPLRVPPPPELAPQIKPTLPPGQPAIVPTTRPLTIDQAVEIGLQHQPNVGIAHQAVEAARGRTRQSQSQLGPSVSVTSSYAHSTTSGGALSGTSDTYNQGVSARQLLFDFGHTRASVRATRLSEAATRSGEARTREDTVFDIQQAYYILLEDERLSQVAEQTVAAQRGHLDEANALFSAGRGSQVDVLKAQTNLADALLTLSNARNSEALARTSLNSMMGIDVRTPTQVAETPPPDTALPDLNALVEKAEGARPEVLEARQTLGSSEASLQSARTSNKPIIVANGSLGLRGNRFPGDTNSTGVSVSLQWTPFDSGLTRGRVQEATAAVETARLQLRQATQTVDLDVTQAFLNVQGARQRVITSDAEVANAQETLRVAEGRYRAQVGIFLEVTDAQAALASAQGNQVDAVYGLNIALAALNRAVGADVR